MPKYGRGLNKEIYLAVKQGKMDDTFGAAEVKNFANKKGWDIPYSYINVCLTRATTKNHSLNYKKYFKSVGNGKYELSLDCKS